ncbi:MAG TPA: ribonuclease H-like domain-containing protein [Candidatus Merdenecus merdavium]|nr:ribonuclease H-like domain-containing protein [Candidatus Merdenecus merdavium]
MKIINENLDIEVEPSLRKISPLENILFFDIETTGFSHKTSSLYLIGCIYYQDHRWHLKQFFGEGKQEECELLQSFYDFSKTFTTWVNYNGNGFDFPYLTGKYQKYFMDIPFVDIHKVDLYQSILPYKKILKLPSLKQKNIEQYLNMKREDPFDGGQLIELYHVYMTTGDEKLLHVLLLHNKEDLIGLTKLIPLLHYSYLFKGNFMIQDLNFVDGIAFDGREKLEVILTFTFDHTIPVPFSHTADGIYFTCNRNHGKLKIPVYTGTLKFFYPNYKDYYYLPEEDIALHKSVATYVDKEFRVQAKANTCYGKKDGLFLPQFIPLYSPEFKEHYHSKETYFECNQEMMDSSDSLHDYIHHLLQHLRTSS